MEVGEAQPAVLSELVDVRGADLAAEAADVAEAEVVGDDDEEVGPLRGGHLGGMGWSGEGCVFRLDACVEVRALGGNLRYASLDATQLCCSCASRDVLQSLHL